MNPNPPPPAKKSAEVKITHQQFFLWLVVLGGFVFAVGLGLFCYTKSQPGKSSGFTVIHAPRDPVDTAGYRVNINTASVAELATLPGIGEATAHKIVQEREANGLFHNIDDLERVNGIGAKKIQNMRNFLTPIASPEVLVEGSPEQDGMLYGGS